MFTHYSITILYKKTLYINLQLYQVAMNHSLPLLHQQRTMAMHMRQQNDVEI